MVESGVNVEFDCCKFYCSLVDELVVLVEGIVKFFECKVSNSRGGGIIVEGDWFLVFLMKCYVCGNGNKLFYLFGISVLNGGNLMV